MQKNILNNKLIEIFKQKGYFIHLSYDSSFIATLNLNNASKKVQTKTRLTFDQKYLGNDLYIFFEDKESQMYFLYPHDILLYRLSILANFKNTSSWKDKGIYHWPRLSNIQKLELFNYKL